MVLRNKDGREIEIEIYGQHDDDLQCEGAVYVDDGTDASDTDVDYLMNTYYDNIYEQWFMNQVSAAEDYYEGDR